MIVLTMWTGYSSTWVLLLKLLLNKIWFFLRPLTVVDVCPFFHVDLTAKFAGQIDGNHLKSCQRDLNEASSGYILAPSYFHPDQRAVTRREFDLIKKYLPLQGYTRSREYIVTEWPMQDTISDCWSLIYDHDCNSVVILANPEDESVNNLNLVLHARWTRSLLFGSTSFLARPAFWAVWRPNSPAFV